MNSCQPSIIASFCSLLKNVFLFFNLFIYLFRKKWIRSLICWSKSWQLSELGNSFGIPLLNLSKGISHFAIPWKSELKAHCKRIFRSTAQGFIPGRDRSNSGSQSLEHGWYPLMFTFAYDCFNSTCLSPTMTPPGFMSLEKINPRLQTIFFHLCIWFLSLAVCFWGLRRVKYAWLQHGWLNLKKTTTNKWHEIFILRRQTEFWMDCFFGKRTPREPELLTRFVCFFWKGHAVIFTERTHTKQVCDTHICTSTHTYASIVHWLRRRQT